MPVSLPWSERREVDFPNQAVHKGRSQRSENFTLWEFSPPILLSRPRESRLKFSNGWVRTGDSINCRRQRSSTGLSFAPAPRSVVLTNAG